MSLNLNTVTKWFERRTYFTLDRICYKKRYRNRECNNKRRYQMFLKILFISYDPGNFIDLLIWSILPLQVLHRHYTCSWRKVMFWFLCLDHSPVDCLYRSTAAAVHLPLEHAGASEEFHLCRASNTNRHAALFHWVVHLPDPRWLTAQQIAPSSCRTNQSLESTQGPFSLLNW